MDPLSGASVPSGVRLTDRKAWTMSALMELSGLSLMTTKICSSFSRLMKFPNQDFLASLGEGRGAEGWLCQGTLCHQQSVWGQACPSLPSRPEASSLP